MSLWAFRFVLFYLTILLVQPQNRFVILWPFRIALVCMALAFILHVLSASQEGRPIIRFGPATITALILMAVSWLSNQFGVFQASSGWNANIDIIWKNAICLIMIEAMATTVERVWAVFGTMLMATLWWIKGGLRLSSAGAVYAGDRLMGPAVGLVENPNSFAFMMTLMIPIYLYFYQNSHIKWIKGAYLFCALSAVFIALQTGSRTGLLCLIAVGVFILPKYGAKYKGTLIAVGLAVPILLGSVGAMNLERYKTIGDSISNFFSGAHEQMDPSEMNADQHSAWERKMKNKHSWALILRYPVFGVGVNKSDSMLPGEFAFAFGQVHNDWLYIGVQMGFIGMGLYASLMICVFLFSSRIQREAKMNWPALSDLGWTIKLMGVVFVVGGFFSPIGWNPLFMATAGASSALWLNYQNKSWNKATEKFY
ncbi:MAG TPA: O-antigen ligase family protein [Kiritimatiellia bacterium]|nr:O-antigen ligase family protein [Kiritimatiellia bacterium]